MRWRHHRARRLGSLVAACALVGACTGDQTADDEPVDSAAVAPLTGLPLDGSAVAGRPAVVVKVDDSARALGLQEGLAEADVVYSERVEGGATRLAAIYHSDDADSVGPVRSARTTDLGILAPLRTPLLAFSGANGAVARMVDEADVVGLSYDEQPRLYTERGTGVLRLFVDTDDVYARATQGASPPPSLFTFRGDGEEPEGGEPVEEVEVDYGGDVGTHVRYEPDGDGWARFREEEPHVDADGDQVTPENVVIQFTEYRDSGFVDVTGAASPEAVLVGEGDAWILTGGVLFEGRWARADADNVTTYRDASGQPLTLAPGRTWVELAPIGSASAERGPPAADDGPGAG